MRIIRSTLLASALILPGIAQAQDAFRWLESPTDGKALAWAEKQTARAEAAIAAMPDHAAIGSELKSALAAGDPPPQYALLGPWVVRFQTSVAHPHGILSVARRAANGVPAAWRDVLDVDALRATEHTPYELDFFNLADSCLPPAYDRCMLALSPAGSDDTELREFDLRNGQFIANGFTAPASRSSIVWLDRDRLLIANAVGDAPKLATGWPATIAIWRRGLPATSAQVIYKARPQDAIMTLAATSEGHDRVSIISRWSDYSNVEMSIVRQDGTVENTGLPARQKMTFSPAAGGRIFVALAADAVINGKTVPAETILSYDTAAGEANARRLRTVYTPAAGDFITDPISGVAAGPSSARFVVARRGVNRIDTANLVDGQWRVTRGKPEPVGTSISFPTADREGDQAIVQRTGFLLPTELAISTSSGPATNLFREEPAFDASKFAVELKVARSKDGTDVDYFLLRPRSPSRPGATPTLITGYGAFGVTTAPGYLDATVGGRSLLPWLARGGALALALIRGGGDRGEAWHLAAIRDKRQNSYDDFAAVTEALIADRFTMPKHIGAFGSSNGGLLAAVMGI